MKVWKDALPQVPHVRWQMRRTNEMRQTCSFTLAACVFSKAVGLRKHHCSLKANRRLLASKGILVQEASGNQVVCGKTMEGGDAVLAQLIVGNSYSTTPERKFRFIIYQSGADVKVTAQELIESQMAFAQMQKHEFAAITERSSSAFA